MEINFCPNCTQIVRNNINQEFNCCPHCGYSFEQETVVGDSNLNNSIMNLNEDSTNFKEAAKTRKRLLFLEGVLSFIISFIVLLFGAM